MKYAWSWKMAILLGGGGNQNVTYWIEPMIFHDNFILLKLSKNFERSNQKLSCKVLFRSKKYLLKWPVGSAGSANSWNWTCFSQKSSKSFYRAWWKTLEAFLPFQPVQGSLYQVLGNLCRLIGTKLQPSPPGKCTSARINHSDSIHLCRRTEGAKLIMGQPDETICHLITSSLIKWA